MRHVLIGALAAAFAFALIEGASGAGAHVSTSPPPFAPRHGGISGIVPAPRSPLRPLPPLGGHDLTYHGGPVMRSNTVYAIYWVPSGYSLPASYAATINQYFTDVAADSGRSTNVYVNGTSNVLGLLSAPSLLAALALGGWVRWHRTCKVPYCLRLGEHPVKGTTAKVCSHHHTLEHHRLVHDHNQVEGRLGWGESHDRPTRPRT